MKVSKVIRFGIIAVLAVLFTVVGLLGTAIGRYDIFPLWQQTQKGMDIQNGSRLVMAPAKETDLSEADLNIKIDECIQKVRLRLDAFGYQTASIYRQGKDKILIEVPVDSASSVTKIMSLMQFLTSQGKMEFFDPDDNKLIDETQIKGLTAVSTTANTFGLAFVLSDEGKTVFANAAESLKDKSVTMKLDGQLVASITYSPDMAAGEFTISGGDFTQDKAMQVAYSVQTGSMPIELTADSMSSLSATLGENIQENISPIAIIGILLMILLLTVLYRLPGFVAGLSLIFLVALSIFFLAAFIVVTTAATLCGILFGLFTAAALNISVFENARADMKVGRTLKASLEAGYKKTNKNARLLLALILIVSVTLLIAGSALILSFGLGVILSVIAAYLSFLLAQYIIRTFVDLNITKAWLYFGASKARKEEV